MELSELKQEYEKLRNTHNLPTFEEMNIIFELGKIEKNTGNLLRDIRKICAEKTSHYLRLIELMLNPAQASPIFLILLKEVNAQDKKVMDEVFTSFMDLEIEFYKLDVEYSAEGEANFIKKVYETWNNNVAKILKIIEILERNWKNNNNKQNVKSRDYFN